MDLKIDDVADLLNVSDATVKKWLSDGNIPSYKLNDEVRFSRTEIEDWIVRNDSDTEQSLEERHKTGGAKQYALFRAVHKGGVIQNAQGATKDEIIRSSCKTISQHLHFDADVMSDLLLDREKLMPTALNNGIAIPHTREITFNTHFDAVTVVFPEKPIDYGALDHKPVHTLFFLFACDDKRHLNLLAKIAHLSRDPNSLDYLRKKPSKQELLSFVKRWEEGIS